MTEWWLILALFWAWYLADCLKASAHARFLFANAWGRHRARASHGQILPSPPSPLAWHTSVDDPPYSLSPHGICNAPTGAAGHPSPEPDSAVAWRWADIKEVTQKRGRIFINGSPFCPATKFANAKELRALASHCASLPPDARAAFLSRQVEHWFRPAHLRRCVTALTGRTSAVADLATFNFVVALAVTIYLLANGPAYVGDLWAERLVRALPLLGAYFALIHVATLVFAWRAHRHLLPAHGERRLSLVLNASMLPPQALRLRAQIATAYFPAAHPLTWLAAAGRDADFFQHARHTVTDLRWPLPPPHPNDAALVNNICAWMRAQVTGHVDRLLKARGVTLENLLTAPTADSSASCAYCPRCRDQFTSPTARCPRGVPALPLK